MAINIFCILLLFLSCGTNSNQEHNNWKVENVSVDTLGNLSKQWRSDSLGCNKVRSIEVFEKLFKEYSLQGKDEGKFVKVLGMPNNEEVYADRRIIIYYFNSICKANQIIKGSDKSSIRITFDLQRQYRSYDTRIE